MNLIYVKELLSRRKNQPTLQKPESKAGYGSHKTFRLHKSPEMANYLPIQAIFVNFKPYKNQSQLIYMSFNIRSTSVFVNS